MPINNRRFATPFIVGNKSSASLLGGGSDRVYQDLNNLSQQGAQQEWDDAERERARRIDLEDRAFRDRTAATAEDRRRFDLSREDQAARRSQFDSLMQLIFGGGSGPQAEPGGANALRFASRGGGYGQPADDGIDRRSINNSLARFIRGGM